MDVSSVSIQPKIHPSWLKVLESEFQKPYFQELKAGILKDREDGITIYPPPTQIFNAYNRCPFDKVKVVILGQDPYHGPGQANGLCFSVADGIPSPPSLKNIFKEIKADLNIDIPATGNLEPWADQGVFLLNAFLTVQARKPASHQKLGWHFFTNATIKALSEHRSGLVFLLWGRFAQQKEVFIDKEKHQILKCPHPSPFSAHSGFFGSKHFSMANDYLVANGEQAINWDLNTK